MAELDPLGVLVQLVHRKVRHPAEPERVALDEPEVLAEPRPRAPGQLLGHRLPVADEEERVALTGAGRGDEPRESVGVDELGDRPLRAAVGQDDVAQSRGPLVARPLAELVEEAPRLGRRAGGRDRPDDGAGGDRRRERREARAPEDVGDVRDQERVAEVRLVGAVLRHRFGERNAGEGRWRHGGAAREFLEHAVQDRLDRREDVLLRDERHLEVELVELAGRAIGASVLVAEARRDLEIAIEPGGHQQLLELLRRLRQRVELPGVYPARHQVVPGPFRRARGQDRRLELGEARLDHSPADRCDDPAPEHDVRVELLAPEVEEAVAQARLLGEFGVAVDLERQGLRRRLHGELIDRQLDLAGRQPRIDRARRARYDLPGHRDHALEAQRFGGLEQWARAVEHALRDSVVVPDVEKQQVAVIALPVEPAGQSNRATHVLAPQLAARVGAKAMHRRRPRWRLAGRAA